MSGLKLEDPTVDVADIEKYRMAFLMQFFVQHKRRFRFPRLRLQDLYQKVLKDPDPVAFCDLAARILRFLNHDDPDICMATLDQALDRFAIDKRTSYRINIQRHRNGKLVHQLGSAARAALLDNLIESVYDEQPDFNFTTCFNSSLTNSGRVGGGGGIGTSNNGPGSTGFDRMIDSSQDLYNSGVGGGAGGDIGCTDDPEDVNVLIKAGQDAQGCSYYYMDDLRLYRERPQSGISSQWDVVVGPTADQWLAFIMSLSRNEKEYDLHCFLKQDLFELVKESLDAMELHAPNTELDSNYLRTKELNELAELRRRQLGHNHHKLTSLSSVENDKLQLNNNNNIVSMSASGPKSASPAFSGGHGCGGGISGIGSSGSSSSTSGAPLTPSSARTPTSAPPASSLQPQQQQQQQASLPPPDCQETQATSMKLEDSSSNQPTVWPQDTMSAKMRTHSGQSPCEAADFIGTPKSEGSNTECSTTTTTTTPSVAFTNANQDLPASQNNSAGVATPTTIPSLLHSLSSPASFSATNTPPTTTGRHHSGVSGGGNNLLNNNNNTITTISSNSNIESDQISSGQLQNCDPMVGESTTVPNNDMSNNFPVTSTATATPTPTPTTTGVSVITGQLPPPSSPITATTTPTPTSSSSSSLLPGVAVVSEPLSISWNSPSYNNCNSNMASSSPSLQQRECKLPPPPTSNDPVSISTQPSSYVRPNNTGGIDDTTTTPTVTVTQPNSNNYLSYSPTCHQSTQQQNQIPGNLTSKQQQQDTHITANTSTTGVAAAKLSSPSEAVNPNLSKMSNSGQFRQMSISGSQQDTSPCSGGGMDYPLPAQKQCLGAGGGGVGGGPATALVSPMIGIPPSDAIAAGVIGGGGGVGGMPPLTQEQWENRKSKIAQLEKIHSTLSKSKSASTPGAIAAATAGAVLQQQQQQQQQRLMRNSMQQQQPPIGLGIPPSSAINNTSPYPDSLGGGTRPFDTENYNSMMTRQGVVVGSSMNSESAQQEWDRLCSDYQRGKTDTSGMMLRYPAASRQMGFFDSNDANFPSQCSTVPPQSMAAPGAGTGTMMLPSGQMMMMDHQQQQQHQQTCQPPAYQSGGVGGGPPVVMVPPNNSNMCPVNSGYPPPSNALTSLPPPDPGRALGPMGTIGPEQQMPTGGAGGGGITPTAGQKRSYHHSVSSGENWPPLNSSNPLSMSPVVQGIENSNFLGHHIPPNNNSSAVCRSGQMMMMPTMMNAPVSSASASSPIGASVAPISQQPAVVGRGSGSTKPSTKKRKAAGSVRGSNVVSNTNYSSSAAPPLPTTHQQQQQLPSPTNQSSHCLKQSPTVITPNKTLNSPYIVNSNNINSINNNDDMMLQNNHFPRSTGNHPPPRPMHQIPPGGGAGGGGRPPFQPNDSCVMHYSDMMCGQNTGSIPIEQSNNNMDMMTMVNSRHSGTPKSGEPFPGGGGPISPTSGAPLGSRTVSSNCSGNNYGPAGAGGGGVNYGISGNMSNKPTNHAYFNSPDTMMMMMGPNSDSMGMRSQAAAAAASAGPNTPCTQHLTSASLASLARLSQMSGPEGPYIPSSTSSLYTSTIGSGVGSGGGPPSISGHNNTHLNRTGSFHGNNNADGNPIGLPPQGGTTPHHPHHVMPQNTRQHNSLTSPGHCGVSKSHLCNPNQPSLPSNNNNNMVGNNFNLPHSLSNQTLPVHSKFNGQGYPPHMNHPQLQPTLQHQQHQQALTGSSLPSPVPNMPVPQPQPQPPPPPQQHQQPPSIQVNNTFFNAQLNVQQMNYQHVSAPGSTGQMQIHFAQQQQQPPPHDHMRSVRQTDSSTIRMTNPPAQQQQHHQPQAPPPQSNDYSSMSSNNPQMLYNNSDPMNHRIDCSKSELPLLPPAPAPHAPPSSSSVITSSMCTPMGTGGSGGVGGGSSVAGYGNASIQITPRTPHTIQYLPTVAPQAGNQGPPGSGGGVGGGGMSSSGPNQTLPRQPLRGSGGGAASGGGGGGYQYIPSDPDSNSSHHSSFQSNQSYAANQNISSQPGQFYPPSAPPNQHYPPMPQSAAAVVAGQQSYASNFQAQNNKNAQVFPGRPMNNNNNNSAFAWNDSSFDSMSSASASASLGGSMIVSSTGTGGGGVGDTASLNSFQASSNMQNQVMDNRLVRNIHHQQGGGSFRDPQMNSYTSSSLPSSCNNDVTTMQSIDPIISDNLSSSSSSNHQMFTSSQPDGSIQQQQHQQQQQRVNAGQQQHQHQSQQPSSQYLRQPMGSSSSSGKPPAASNQMHHQQQTNYQNYYQQHQQHHHHQQQQQHHQMMMSSSASICGDYSAGSGDWSSTNQVQFVMSNSASSSSTMSSNTSNTSTMYNNCSSSTTINNNGSNMHNNNIVDNIPSNLTDNTNNLRSSVSNPTINNMENNNNNMGHHPTGKRLSVPNVPMTNNELDIKNPMHQYNSPHSSHVFPSQQQQQQMMTSSTVSGGPPAGNRLMMNWHHHPSATGGGGGGGGNPMNFPATMSSVSSPNTNTNNPREMYSGQMMNSSKLFPPMMGSSDPTGMTTLGGGGMSDNSASNNNNNNNSGNRNMNMLRQSQENCYENNQLANIASSTSSSTSSSASTAQAYSSSVV